MIKLKDYQQGAGINGKSKRQPIPLCVDLDGTLIKTDTLLVTLCYLLKSRPWYLLWLPIWLFHGKAHLKHEIARRVELNPARLPYHPELKEFLLKEFKTGRTLVLAT